MISSFFLTLADAAAAPASSPQGLLSNPLIPVLCFGAIFYFLILRPQSKRTKDLQNLVSTLKTGDKVVTNSGIHGIIANVKEGSTLSLKIADNVKIEIDKSAIATVEKDKSPATTAS